MKKINSKAKRLINENNIHICCHHFFYGIYKLVSCRRYPLNIFTLWENMNLQLTLIESSWIKNHLFKASTNYTVNINWFFQTWIIIIMDVFINYNNLGFLLGVLLQFFSCSCRSLTFKTWLLTHAHTYILLGC